MRSIARRLAIASAVIIGGRILLAIGLWLLAFGIICKIMA
jgi:hypothetical protein